MQRRSVGHAETRSTINIEAIGNPDESVGSDSDTLARSTISGICHHAIADGEFRHAGTQGLDRAAAFRGWRKRQWRLCLVLVGDDQGVKKVQRCGLDTQITSPGPAIGSAMSASVKSSGAP